MIYFSLEIMDGTTTPFHKTRTMIINSESYPDLVQQAKKAIDLFEIKAPIYSLSYQAEVDFANGPLSHYGTSHYLKGFPCVKNLPDLT